MPAQTTVITPVRNGAAYIAKAITSVLPQLDPADEFFVINDRSTDATASIVALFDDPRIRLISAPRAGASAARNAGLALATGEFIAFLDADDEWPPGRQSALVARLAERPDVHAVFGHINIKLEADALPQNYGGVDGQFLPNGQLGTGLFRHSVIKLAGGFAEDMLAAEDVDFFNRLQEAGMVFDLIACPSLVYRRHASNATNDTVAVRRWFMEMLRRKIARERARNASVVCPESSCSDS